MSYIDVFDLDTDKDLLRTRLVDIGKEHPVKIQAEDPYGLWSITWHVGVTPEVLRGKYTTYDYAKAALDAYLSKISRMEVKKEAGTPAQQADLVDEIKDRKPVLRTKRVKKEV